jgi:L-seryl-tRNA(Ser) seleniumtransferase
MECNNLNLAGTIDGDAVEIRSNLAENAHGDSLSFTFSGKAAGDAISGELDMGEYLKGRWSAKRHQYGRRA